MALTDLLTRIGEQMPGASPSNPLLAAAGNTMLANKAYREEAAAREEAQRLYISDLEYDFVKQTGREWTPEMYDKATKKFGKRVVLDRPRPGEEFSNANTAAAQQKMQRRLREAGQAGYNEIPGGLRFIGDAAQDFLAGMTFGLTHRIPGTYQSTVPYSIQRPGLSDLITGNTEPTYSPGVEFAAGVGRQLAGLGAASLPTRAGARLSRGRLLIALSGRCLPKPGSPRQSAG